MQTARRRGGHGWYTAGEFDLSLLPASIFEESAS